MINKTTMPEPVVEVDKHIVSSELQYTYLAPCGGLEHGTEFITTDQAEAYANERVKQALEDAANVCAAIAIPIGRDSPDKSAALECAVAIRALIPKE